MEDKKLTLLGQIDNMSSASFKIIFYGSSLENSSMDVRDLAPALLAFGSLLEESNRILNGSEVSAAVRVKHFEGGCFGVDFDVIQRLSDQIITSLIGNRDIIAASMLISLLGFGNAKDISLGLWKLTKWLKGKKPEKIDKLENGNTKIEFSGNTIQINNSVFNLYANPNIRKALSDTVKPLDHEGIDRIEIKSNDEIIDSTSKKEAEYFHVPEFEKQIINEDFSEKFFSILSLGFKEDYKWRLSDGSAVFSVTIKDKEFLERVDKNLSFSKGDLLKVKLLTRALQTVDGLKTEYEAIKIMDHVPAAKQLSIPFK